MPDELIPIASFEFLPEAEVARLHLEDEGISAFIADGETISMDWLLGNAIGYVKLQVPASQVEAARAALERTRALRKPRETKDQSAADAPLCLACGAAFPVTLSACSACGWSFVGQEGEVAPTDDEEGTEEGSETADEPSAMDDLRALKPSIFLLVFGPLLLMVVLLVFAFLAWIVRAVAP